MPKKCVKCDNEFPFTMIVEGKRRNLKNRKYCLECSPFGKHNTKQIHTQEVYNDGLHHCAKCEVRQERDKFYTKTDGRPYSYCKVCWNDLRVEKTRENKRQAVEYLGGCCERCGYSKCIRALEFHHKDPTQKEFLISKYTGAGIEKIKPELDKCMLLCANCHREVHAELDEQKALDRLSSI